MDTCIRENARERLTDKKSSVIMLAYYIEELCYRKG